MWPPSCLPVVPASIKLTSWKKNRCPTLFRRHMVPSSSVHPSRTGTFPQFQFICCIRYWHDVNRLTGILGFQCLRYYMLYPDDRYATKILVRISHISPYAVIDSPQVSVVWSVKLLFYFLSAFWPVERFLDLMHTCFVCAALVYYFITHFGNRDKIAHIPWYATGVIRSCARKPCWYRLSGLSLYGSFCLEEIQSWFCPCRHQVFGGRDGAFTPYKNVIHYWRYPLFNTQAIQTFIAHW